VTRVCILNWEMRDDCL